MRSFPWLVGVPTFILSLCQLVIELYRSHSASGSQHEDTGDLQVDLSMGIRDVAVGAERFFRWLFGFFRCIWIFGFFIAVPLYTLLYLRLEANESWLLSVVLTMATLVFFVVLFDQVFHPTWSEPLLASPEEFIRAWIPQLPEFE